MPLTRRSDGRRQGQGRRQESGEGGPCVLGMRVLCFLQESGPLAGFLQ